MKNIYYTLKPFIPRQLQIAVRRQMVLRKRPRVQNIWPIDRNASKPPDGWSGWPEQKRFAVVMMHDVDTAKGHDKARHLMGLEKRLGFRSSFNFVPERYNVSPDLRHELIENGFEVGVHGLKHDGKLFSSKRIFEQRAPLINNYLKEWNSVGFSSPSMHHNLKWMDLLKIEYATSTFDTDPFEPQPEGVSTIFPFLVNDHPIQEGHIEIPYTLPQDFTLFVLMKEKNIEIWKKKLDWIAEKGGMVLLNTHPDYMNFSGKKIDTEEYPSRYYEEFLEYIKSRYDGQYWQPLPREVAHFYKKTMAKETPRSNLSTEYSHLPQPKTIWIDLDNSPHVVFFDPIIKELEKQGHRVFLTARDCFQVCGLADLHNLTYRKSGRHYGKNLLLKVMGTLIRSFQLLPIALKEKPVLAVSHGSRSQLITAHMLGIQDVIIFDYEYTSGVGFMVPDWFIAPEIIRDTDKAAGKSHALTYPGIKEDVYVPTFKPDPGILNDLGLRHEDLIITIRPPATEAHYHNPESEELFSAVIELLGNTPGAQIVILPRNEKKQTAWIKSKWSEWCANRKIIIPDHVVDGLNLIWYSDFVVSGGGTMNREAAALGVPVYSIFRGTIGAVDHYLSNNGRLTLLESVEDVKTKMKIGRRDKPATMEHHDKNALNTIVKHVIDILEKQ